MNLNEKIERGCGKNMQIGSLLYLKSVSSQYEDILDVEKAEEPTRIIILCKEDYDKSKVDDFLYKHFPLSVDYEIHTKKDNHQ